MSNKELHLFIIWHNAYKKKKEVLQDIRESFTIRNIFEIEWSDEFFNSNLTRFYGTSLPAGCDKELHCGRDKFTLVVVEVKNPIYESRMTSHGQCIVCKNIFDKKQQYRMLTAGIGSHMIHATDNIDEFEHDITLLLGVNKKDFIKNYKKSDKVMSIKRDVPGASKKWNSLEELFYVLNTTINYVVLRDFENDMNELFISDSYDVDILTVDKEQFKYIVNSDYENNGDMYININNTNCLFGIKDYDSCYYSNKMITDILTKKMKKNYYYTPNEEYHYYSSLYHALFHKNNYETEYNYRLEYVFGKKIHDSNKPKTFYIDKISDWMKKNNYPLVINLDDMKKNNIDNMIATNMISQENVLLFKRLKSIIEYKELQEVEIDNKNKEIEEWKNNFSKVINSKWWRIKGKIFFWKK